MAIVLTKTKIISQASLLLNNGIVDTINSPNEFVQAASEAYDLLLPSTISNNNWRFATGVEQLSKLADEPPVDRWKDAFLLPAQYLTAVRTYPNVPYQIYENMVWTNAQDMSMEYRFLPDVSRLPFYFVDYFVYELAEHLALAVATRDDIAGFLNKKKMEKLARANWADNEAHYQDDLVNFPVISSRFLGSNLNGE